MPDKSIPVFSLADYDPEFQKVIHAFKFSRLRRLAKPLAGLFAHLTADQWEWQRFDGILFVPTSKPMFLQRHFDHMEILARCLQRALRKRGIHLPLLKNILVPAKNARPQVGLGRAARQTNAKSAFVFSGKTSLLDRTQHLLVLDDVITTGATFSQIAKLLLEQKPELKISGLSMVCVKNPANRL